MPMNAGRPEGSRMVPPENLRTGGGTETSGEVVMAGMPRRMVPPDALQVSGGPAGAQEENIPADRMGEARMVPAKFLNAPIVGNPNNKVLSSRPDESSDRDTEVEGTIAAF